MNRYYYADEKKVPLNLADDLIAIHDFPSDEAPLSPSERTVRNRVRSLLDRVAKSLRPDLKLAQREKIPADVYEHLKGLGLVQPVYRAQGALIVPLPEVRVEENRPDRQNKLKAWIRKHPQLATVKYPREGQFIFIPASGQGDDALALANALAEEVSPEMAQARFIRVTPRFSVTNELK